MFEVSPKFFGCCVRYVYGWCSENLDKKKGVMKGDGLG